MKTGWCLAALLLASFLLLWLGLPVAGAAAAGGDVMERLTLTSTAFPDQGTIPSQYTCDGADVSPPLAWTEMPAGTESFALIVEDPDAPAKTWVHWVIYNVPAEKKSLAENISAAKELSGNIRQGINDFRKIGYRGPCPPSGKHHYFFNIYALDTLLALRPGASKKELLAAMENHVLAQGQLVGIYGR